MTFLLSLLTGTWARLAGIVAGIALLVFGIRKAGADAVRVEVERDRAEAERRRAEQERMVRHAEGNAPRDFGGLADRMRREAAAERRADPGVPDRG